MYKKMTIVTDAEKKHYLQNLESEVDDFHPILQQLFPRLQNIIHQEYTHGPNEMGADFILQKKDDTTGQTRWIGVIAKRGTVGQSNDVLTQLNECFSVPRKIAGGTQEIKINEVWVVASGNISNNAQEKFYHGKEYNSVTFIPGDELVRLIDKYAPNIWNQKHGQLGIYVQQTRDRLVELDRTTNLLGEWAPTKAITMEVSAIETDGYKQRNLRKSKRSKNVNLIEEIEAHRFIFLEGIPGSGKSFLMRRVAKELLASVDEKPKFIPLFCTFRELEQKCDGSLLSVVNNYAATIVGDNFFAECRFVIFVDGLDEYLGDRNYDSIINSLSLQVGENLNLSIVISSRSGAIPEADIRAISNLRHLRLNPISFKNIASFIREVLAQSKRNNRIINDMEKSDLFRQLPRSPIAALLLSKLLLEGLDELPQTITELYRTSIELMLGRWDIRKSLVTQQEYEISKRLSAEISEKFMREKTNTFTVEQVKELLNGYFEKRNLVTDTDKIIGRLISRDGIFSLDQRTNLLTFRHRSFAEFLMAEKLLNANSLEFDQRVLDSYWRNVYFFACGLNPDCEQVLKGVLSVSPSTEFQRWSRIISSADFMLAAHMSPYNLVEIALPELMIEAARLYNDIVKGRIESAIGTAFSEIQMTWIFAYLIKSYYAYAFFEKALDDAAININEFDDADDVKAVALFFLGIIGMELGNSAPIEFLAETYSPQQIPFVVALAIGVETDRFKGVKFLPPRIRAFNKHTRKMLKSHHEAGKLSMSDYLNRLFTQKIRRKALPASENIKNGR